MKKTINILNISDNCYVNQINKLKKITEILILLDLGARLEKIILENIKINI